MRALPPLLAPLLLLAACRGGDADSAADPASDKVAAKAVADVDAATAAARGQATPAADAPAP